MRKVGQPQYSAMSRRKGPNPCRIRWKPNRLCLAKAVADRASKKSQCSATSHLRQAACVGGRDHESDPQITFRASGCRCPGRRIDACRLQHTACCCGLSELPFLWRQSPLNQIVQMTCWLIVWPPILVLVPSQNTSLSHRARHPVSYVAGKCARPTSRS